MQAKMAELKKRHLQDLDLRRDRLRALIKEEDDMYKAEIKGLEETPDQVRDRMIKRVAELKNQKEQQRQAFVE